MIFGVYWGGGEKSQGGGIKIVINPELKPMFASLAQSRASDLNTTFNVNVISQREINKETERHAQRQGDKHRDRTTSTKTGRIAQRQIN